MALSLSNPNAPPNPLPPARPPSAPLSPLPASRKRRFHEISKSTPLTPGVAPSLSIAPNNAPPAETMPGPQVLANIWGSLAGWVGSVANFIYPPNDEENAAEQSSESLTKQRNSEAPSCKQDPAEPSTQASNGREPLHVQVDVPDTDVSKTSKNKTIHPTQQLPSPQPSDFEEDNKSSAPHVSQPHKMFRPQPQPAIDTLFPLDQLEQPFYPKPRKINRGDGLKRALTRRDKCSPRGLASITFPNHMLLNTRPLKAITNTPFKGASSMRFASPKPSPQVNDHQTQTPRVTRGRVPEVASTLRRSSRLAPAGRSVVNGRIGKSVKKNSKPSKEQEAYRKSQQRAREENNSLTVLLKQLIESKEQGFQSLKEVEKKRKEREEEIRKLREEDAKNKIKREGVRPLPVEHLKKVKNTFSEVIRDTKGGRRKTYITKWSIPITTTDLIRLQPGTWLNDEIINFYLNLICERSNGSDPSVPKKVFAHNTFFWVRMKTNGYQSVARWARRAKCGGEAMLKLYYLLLPVHVGENHWCMAVVNRPLKRFEYYDSLGGNFTPQTRQEPYKLMREYVKQETGGKFDFNGWTDYAMKGAPQQSNAFDCGVFALKTAEVITKGGRMDFTAADMPLLRQQIMAEILQGGLLDVSSSNKDEDSNDDE